MYIVTVLYLFFVFFSVRRIANSNSKQSCSEGYSVNNTTAVKGLLSIGILLSHMPKFTPNELPFTATATIGSIGVGAFFFLSGFAIHKTTYTKQISLCGFFKKKASRILVLFLFMLCFYVVFELLSSGSIKPIINSFIKGYPISNSWYVIAILVFYVFYYLSFKFGKTKPLGVSFAILSCLTVLYCVIVMCIFRWSDWWYKTCITFIIGVAWAAYEKHIVKFVNRFYVPCFLLGLVFAACSYLFPGICNRINIHFEAIWTINDGLMGLAFALFMAVILCKFSFKNKLTLFLGNVSYEIYLWHGLVMNALAYIFNTQDSAIHQEVFSLLVILLTLAVSILFHKISAKLLANRRG